MAVHLKYFQKFPNAGDQFSRLIAQRYFSPDIIPCDNRALAEPNLILLGSILEWADAMSYVCGAGLISPGSKLDAAPRNISCVRGPLTALILEKQGIRMGASFGDPGILASRIFPQTKPSDTNVGVIPHYVDRGSPWLGFCRDQGVPVIDPFSPLEEFFDGLQRCETILSSSLHGLIFAHAYGKPALWIELSNRIIGDGFKFLDYYSSIGIWPEHVTRMRISSKVDPYDAAKRATVGDHTQLLLSLDAALQTTKLQLQEAGS